MLEVLEKTKKARRLKTCEALILLVGLGGLEPQTSSMSTKRSNQLSYNPIFSFCRISRRNIVYRFSAVLSRDLDRIVKYMPLLYNQCFNNSLAPTANSSKPAS
jgi:hypothetical protein